MLICRDCIEIKSSHYLFTLPWEWCHDDAKTSAFNVNIRLLTFNLNYVFLKWSCSVSLTFGYKQWRRVNKGYLPYYMKFSRHVNFAILRKYFILTSLISRFWVRHTFFLCQRFLTCPWIWSNNLINNVQINRNVTDYVNSNKKDVLTVSTRHGL